MGSSADGIVYCACGHRHWGHAGAAGILAWRDAHDPEVIMQLRAGWSMSGGTWGIPGGAIGYGESPIEGGLREAHEEAGLGPARVWASTTLHHPDWSYTTGIAEASAGQRAIATDHESDAMEWVPWKNLEERLLMPAFKESMPLLEALLGRTLLVVDFDRLPADWEQPIAELAASGIPSTILPTEVQDPILAGMAAARIRTSNGRSPSFPTSSSRVQSQPSNPHPRPGPSRRHFSGADWVPPTRLGTERCSRSGSTSQAATRWTRSPSRRCWWRRGARCADIATPRGPETPLAHSSSQPSGQHGYGGVLEVTRAVGTRAAPQRHRLPRRWP